MALNLNHFKNVAISTDEPPRTYKYWSADKLADMIAADYFDPAFSILHVSDIIICFPETVEYDPGDPYADPVVPPTIPTAVEPVQLQVQKITAGKVEVKQLAASAKR